MKLVAISDTHTKHSLLDVANSKVKLPDGDLLLHAGDFTSVGNQAQVENFLEWLVKNSTRYTYGVVFIAGNHDRSFDPKFNLDDGKVQKPDWLRVILHDFKPGRTSVTYLENEEVTINRFKIWGSPITPWFYGHYWAFNKQRGLDIQEVWDQIPSDVDIIMTHGPVMGKLDYVPTSGVFVGCEELKRKIEEVKPLLHVAGHIHEGHGRRVDDYTIYVNASVCDHNYDVVNPPIEIELNKEVKPVIY